MGSPSGVGHGPTRPSARHDTMDSSPVEPMVRVLSLLGVLILLPLAIACGGETGPPSATSPHWTWPAGDRTTTPILPPEARLGVPDPHGGPPHVVLNVFANGDVVLKGHRWWLAASDPEDREESRIGLRTQLVTLARNDDERGLPVPLPVLLYADRETPWSVIRAVLGVLRAAKTDTEALQWAVQVGTDARRRVDGRLGAEPSEGSPLVLRIVPEPVEASTAVRIFTPEGVHAFGPPSGAYADERFVHRANATWDELERALPALARGHGAVHLEIDDERADVGFAYVVKAVDLLFGAGFAEVRLPHVDLVMTRPPDA